MFLFLFELKLSIIHELFLLYDDNSLGCKAAMLSISILGIFQDNECSFAMSITKSCVIIITNLHGANKEWSLIWPIVCKNFKKCLFYFF